MTFITHPLIDVVETSLDRSNLERTDVEKLGLAFRVVGGAGEGAGVGC